MGIEGSDSQIDEEMTGVFNGVARLYGLPEGRQTVISIPLPVLRCTPVAGSKFMAVSTAARVDIPARGLSEYGLLRTQ
jgi:hypothetical protein